MKKILFIQPTITHRAGIDMAIKPIIRHLSDKYKVSTLSLYEKDLDIREYKNEAINYTLAENIDHIYKNNIYRKVQKMYNRAKSFYKYVSDIGPDIVIVSSDGATISMAILIVYLKLCNYIYNRFGLKNKVNTPRFISYMHENMKNISNINRWLLHYALPQADKVVCVSEGLSDSIEATMNLNDNKIITIYNTFEKDKREIVKIRKSNFEKKRILAIGRLEKIKGYEEMIRSFANIVRDGEEISLRHDVELIIIGEGQERKALEKLIDKLEVSQSVHLLGAIDHDDIYEQLQKSYAFVNNSKMETFGVSLLEAMSMGVPVIINNCEYGPREICEQEDLATDENLRIFDYGIMVRAGDTHSLSSAMQMICEEKVYNNFNTLRELSRVERFETNRILRSWEELMNTI